MEIHFYEQLELVLCWYLVTCMIPFSGICANKNKICMKYLWTQLCFCSCL